MFSILKFVKLGASESILEQEGNEMEVFKEYLLKTQMKETDFEEVTERSLLN